ncbi:MAG: hypothetical protein U0Q22_08330 [Acidimicrobiales bacterium]
MVQFLETAVRIVAVPLLEDDCVAVGLEVVDLEVEAHRFLAELIAPDVAVVVTLPTLVTELCGARAVAWRAAQPFFARLPPPLQIPTNRFLRKADVPA